MSVCKRVKTLLIPYLFWCILYGVLTQIPDKIDVLLTFRFWLECVGFSPTRVLPLYCQMWYVRNLFILCLVSPILIAGVLIVSQSRVLQIFSAVTFVVVSVVDFPLKDQLVMSTAYFMIGIFLGFNSKWLTVRIPTWVCFAWVMVVLARGFGRQLASGAISSYLHWVAIALTILIVWRAYDFAIKYTKIDSFLGKCWVGELQNMSFFLYCFHMWIVLQFGQWPSALQGQVLQPIIQTSVVASGAFVIYYGIKKFFPMLYRLSTGGR